MNPMYYSTKKYRNKLISDVKNEIKSINAEIDSKLVNIQDDYSLITEKANNLYEELCTIYNDLNYKNFNSENDDIILDYFLQIDAIKAKLSSLKDTELTEDLLTKKVKDLIHEDLCKIKFIQMQLKKLDNKACMLGVNMSLGNIFKKINDYCGDIFNDFVDNYELKIINLITHIMSGIIETIPEEVTELNKELNFLDKTNNIPKEYRNKKLTFKELAKIAEENGFVYSRDKGDHQIYKHSNSGKIVVIPYKGNSTAPIGTQQSILNSIFSNSKYPILAS
ncbi:MAG: type II toxin-antitoxin system HicA family toxin [Romboutsia sp.]|nr:type II toxin-antitoxin system HicA family toxin [Romboutsia sp.]